MGSEYAGTSQQVALNGQRSHPLRNVAVPDGDHLRKVTHEGDAQLASVDLGTVRAVQWKSKAGIALEGIVTFPAGYVEGKKYPFLVLPHGGPEANDDLTFDSFSRAIAGLGYVVLQPEYRGSTGYGADFPRRHLPALRRPRLRRCRQRHRLRHRPGMGRSQPSRHLRLERRRLHDLLDRHPDRPLQSCHRRRGHHRLVPVPLDQRHPADRLRRPLDRRRSRRLPPVLRRSLRQQGHHPAAHPPRRADRRVPTFQGIEFFQILAARGKTVRMVTYPGSPHFPNQWEQRLNVFDEITDWLKKYNP
jgi:hypothetical protein